MSVFSTSLIRRLVENVPGAGASIRVFAAMTEGSLHWLLSRLYWRPQTSFRFRQSIFDTAPAGEFLVGSIAGETFIVAAGDQVIGRSLFVFGEFDFDKLAKVRTALGADWTAELLVDIGANVGPICSPAVRRGYFSRAIAIEREPLNYALLVANIALNGLSSKIASLNLAFGDQDRQSLTFELSETNRGDHRVRVRDEIGQMKESDRKTIVVPSETFDTVIGNVDPSRTLIWIDTQGFEGFVLSGAAKAISSRVPVVIEFWPYAMCRCGSYPVLKNALLQAGYVEYKDLNTMSGWLALTSESLDLLKADVETRGPQSYTDLLIR